MPPAVQYLPEPKVSLELFLTWDEGRVRIFTLKMRVEHNAAPASLPASAAPAFPGWACEV